MELRYYKKKGGASGFFSVCEQEYRKIGGRRTIKKQGAKCALLKLN